MAVILLRLMGPMQSWGTQSRFNYRDSDLEPSKSGVVGLICAAMGKPRNDHKAIKSLSSLKMGVRVDRQGTLKSDYHTAQNAVKASGKLSKKGEAVISHRQYLSDACFLVALEGELPLLAEVQRFLSRPVWQIYLGRKSFVPSLPVFLEDGLLPESDNLLDALKNFPFLLPSLKNPPEKLRVETEVAFSLGNRIKQDQPVSFTVNNRQFTLRHLKTDEIYLKDLPSAKEESCIYLA